MNAKNLNFFKVIEGIKPHYIFTQEETFYVFTEMDGNTRGNFFVITKREVDKTAELINKRRLKRFHPRELDIFEFETDKEYRVQRIRSICYILVAKKVLEIEKLGKEVLFINISTRFLGFKEENISNSIALGKPIKSSNNTNKRNKGISLEHYSGICPLCKRKVSETLIRIHLQRTCPKR